MKMQKRNTTTVRRGRIARARDGYGGVGGSAAKALGFILVGLLAAGLTGLPGASHQAEPGVQAGRAGAADSLETILKDLAGYDFAAGVGAPMRLRAHVIARKDDAAARKDMEAKILSFLESGATPGGKMEACRSLRLIAGAAAVPVLEKMLLQPQTTDMARFALEGVPGPEAGKALLSALDKTKGATRFGIVFSLGERGEASALPALERLANGSDRDLALAAVTAVGRIGGSAAFQVLAPLLRKAKDPLRSEAASALLVCAESLLREGKANDAAAAFDRILAAKPKAGLRQAAFRGKIRVAGTAAQELILKTLAGNDADLHGPAIDQIPAIFGNDEIGLVLPFLAKASEAAQVRLTAVLGEYPGDAVRSDILRACESSFDSVRLEALRALGKTGNASVAGFLARRAAMTAGTEQSAAREALAGLRGEDVDAAVLERLRAEDDGRIKGELIQAAGERRITAAKPELISIAGSGADDVRLRAVRALRNIASPADIRDLLSLLFSIEEEAAREEMRNTVAAVARTNPRQLARGNAVEALLQGEGDPRKRADLLRVLGKIGDDTALPLLRRALSDEDGSVVDAAVRALAEWPNPSPRDDVYDVARTSLDLTHRVLSLRAYVRMIGLEPYRAPEGAVADLQKALAVSPRPEEKRLVLGMLPRFPCVTGLKTAESLIADESVREEARLAADRIRTALTNLR